jgi:hypothetical protein
MFYFPNIRSNKLNTFLGKLKLANKQPPTRYSLIEYARSLDISKLQLHGASESDRGNDDTMYRVGSQVAKITRDSLWDALTETFAPKEFLVLMPWSTTDGLEKLNWQKHISDIDFFMKHSDMFETRSQADSDKFRGIRTTSNSKFLDVFLSALGGQPKPVYAGTDAHQFSDYGQFPSHRVTWIKADPTFAGLRQTLIEPASRVFIGDRPDKLKDVDLNPIKYIKSVSIKRKAGSDLSEKWFNAKVPLNSGLVSVVGNKGSGKTGFVDAIALVGNAECPALPFLSSERFRAPPNRAAHFTATLEWSDGTSVSKDLDSNLDPNSPRRVKYLAQDQIETLCNEITREGRSSQFEVELRKVILSHLPEHVRLDASTLDAVIEARTNPHWAEIRQIRTELSALCKLIEDYDTQLSPNRKSALEQELQLRRSELDALEKQKPSPIIPPSSATPEMQKITETLAQLAAQESKLLERKAALSNRQKELAAKRADLLSVDSELKLARKYIEQTVSRIRPLARRHHLEENDLLKLTSFDEPLTASLRSTTDELSAIEQQLSSSAGGIEALLKSVALEIAAARSSLEGPARAYAEYNRALEDWNQRRQALVGRPGMLGTIEHLKAEQERVQNLVPKLRDLAWSKLQALATDILTHIDAVRGIYRDLFLPVQAFVENTEAGKSLQLKFDIRTRPEDFPRRFFTIVTQQRKGTFYGSEEGRAVLDAMLSSRTFSETSDSLAFANEAFSALQKDTRGVSRIPSEQIRKGYSLASLLEFFFRLNICSHTIR